MPVYEYKCSECDKIIEEIKPINTESIICPCGNIAKKIISNSTFILKGGGWYNDGYSKEKPKKKNETK